MSRVNVYLPDDMAEEAKKAGLNISRLTQEAIQSSLAAHQTKGWVQRVAELKPTGVDHGAALEAVRSAKDELEGG